MKCPSVKYRIYLNNFTLLNHRYGYLKQEALNVKPISLIYKVTVGHKHVYLPYSTRLHLYQGCGSGSVLGIGIKGQENEEISVEKMHFLVIFSKNFTTKKV
jgi:hypothetical protein